MKRSGLPARRRRKGPLWPERQKAADTTQDGRKEAGTKDTEETTSTRLHRSRFPLWQRWSAALLVLLGGLAPAAALVGGVGPRIDVEVPWVNPVGATPVVLFIDCPRPGSFSAEVALGSCRARVDWQLDAGRQRRTVLLPPVAGGGHGPLQVDYRFGDQVGSHTAGHPNDQARPFVLLATAKEAVAVNELKNAVEELWKQRGGYRRYEVQLLQPPACPDRWQAFASWQTVLCTEQAWDALDLDQQSALWRWGASGGALIGDTDRVRKALGSTMPLLALERPSASHLPGWFSRRLEDDPAVPDDDRSVPGTEQQPVAGFVTLVILFVLVVGPLNIWWSLRRGQRTRFYIVTPLVSLATCLLLIVYNLLAEGITVRRAIEQWVRIDEGQQAVVDSRLTLYAPLGVGALQLQPEQRIELWNRSDWEVLGARRYYRSGRNDRAVGNLTLDWRYGQQLQGPLAPARVNRSLRLTELRTVRDRPLVELHEDGYRLTNTFAVPLRSCVVVIGPEQDHWVYAGPSLASGASARLEALRDEHRRDEAIWPSREQQRRREAWVTMTSGQFLAHLQEPLVTVPAPAGELVTADCWVHGPCLIEEEVAP